MRLFSPDRMMKIMDRLGVKEDEVITHPMVTRAIEKAQIRVEAHNFDIRKHLLEYDDVVNKQREVVYTPAPRDPARRGHPRRAWTTSSAPSSSASCDENVDPEQPADFWRMDELARALPGAGPGAAAACAKDEHLSSGYDGAAASDCSRRPARPARARSSGSARR